MVLFSVFVGSIYKYQMNALHFATNNSCCVGIVYVSCRPRMSIIGFVMPWSRHTGAILQTVHNLTTYQTKGNLELLTAQSQIPYQCNQFCLYTVRYVYIVIYIYIYMQCYPLYQQYISCLCHNSGRTFWSHIISALQAASIAINTKGMRSVLLLIIAAVQVKTHWCQLLQRSRYTGAIFPTVHKQTTYQIKLKYSRLP